MDACESDQARAPLVPAEKNNAVTAASRRSRTREVTSRYKSPSRSSTSTTASSTAARRFSSPIPTRTTGNNGSSQLTPKRAQSAERKRPSTPPSPSTSRSSLSQPSTPPSPSRPSTPVNDSLDMQRKSASGSRLGETLWPSTMRSLNVSFQSDTISVPFAKKEKPITSDRTLKPSSNVASQKLVERSRSPMKGKNSTDHSENSKPVNALHSRLIDQHRWPSRSGGRVSSSNLLNRSVDLSDRSVRSSTTAPGLRRLSLDSLSRNLQKSGSSSSAKSPESDDGSNRGGDRDSELNVSSPDSSIPAFNKLIALGPSAVKLSGSRQPSPSRTFASGLSGLRRLSSEGLPKTVQKSLNVSTARLSQLDIGRNRGDTEVIPLAPSGRPRQPSPCRTHLTVVTSPSSRGVSPSRAIRPSSPSRGVSPSPSSRGISPLKVTRPSSPSRGVSPSPSARGVSPLKVTRPSSPSRGVSPSPSYRGVTPLKVIRPSSPSRGVSPSRARQSDTFSDQSSSPTSSVLSFSLDVRKGKKTASYIDEAHQLRLLYNRYLQWRFTNAHSEYILYSQKVTTENTLFNVWKTTQNLWDSVIRKRISIQQMRLELKLDAILNAQVADLDDWASLETDHTSSLAGIVDDLEATTLRLPVTSGARAEVNSLKAAVFSAVDVMQATGLSTRSLLSRVEEMKGLVFELATVAAHERAMLNECEALWASTSAMQVQEFSLRAHILQVKEALENGRNQFWQLMVPPPL